MSIKCPDLECMDNKHVNSQFTFLSSEPRTVSCTFPWGVNAEILMIPCQLLPHPGWPLWSCVHRDSFLVQWAGILLRFLLVRLTSSFTSHSSPLRKLFLSFQLQFLLHGCLYTLLLLFYPHSVSPHEANF